MKKQTRIALVLGIALILTLALTIPGLADDPVTYGDCIMDFPAMTSTGTNGPEYVRLPLPGVLTYVGWNEDQTTLLNICEGEVPFGDAARGKGKLTFYTYDELEALDIFVWTEAVAIASFDTMGVSVLVYDLEGDSYQSTYWKAEIYPAPNVHGRPDGHFVFTKEYTP